MSGWSVIFVFVIVSCASIAAWVFAPKGESTTVWRSSIILTLALCYIMWAITYLAQLHPLVAPKRSNLRPEYAE